MNLQKREVKVHLPRAHSRQREFIDSPAKRKIIRAGRRGGKTVGISIASVEWFLKKERVLYAAPTSEQVGRFWSTVTRAFHEPIKAGIFRKNETEKYIEVPGTENRLKAKTAWNADSLRGDYASKLIFDEWQLINEDAWGLVGAPMMLDNNGDAIFIYTPPSLKSRFASKADDPQHAAKMFKRFKQLQESGNSRYACFHFSSKDNPYLSREALDEITQDMTSLGYRMEILAEDVDEAPGALWTRKTIEDNRVLISPLYHRIVVAVDPSTTSDGDEAGIITCGKYFDDGYVIADDSLQGSPYEWARAAVTAYYKYQADCIVAEKNQGGEMVELTIHQCDENVPVRLVHASRGKQARAEPISAKAEKGRIHHVGNFPSLEDELCVDGETLITTSEGLKAIKSIKAGELVLTREGFKPVLRSGQTGIVDKMISISTKSGRNLLTTVHHPIYVSLRGFVKASSLQINDILEVNELWHIPQSEFTSMANPLLSMGNDGLSQRMDIIKIEKVAYFIEKYGKSIMERFRAKLMSTIRMVINLITTYPILKHQIASGMLRITQDIDGPQRKNKDFLNLEKKSGEIKNRERLSVFTAEKHLKQQELTPSFVTANAAEDTIQSIEVIKKQTPVYNLTVAEKPEYYANGILAHNCLWIPGDDSPNRLDAMVWGMTELLSVEYAKIGLGDTSKAAV